MRGCTSIDLARLAEPFEVPELDWRVMRAGRKDGTVWAYVIPYVDARVIMDRLDSVCSPHNWQTQLREEGGMLFGGIGIRVGDEWLWKWDGTGHLESHDRLSAADAGKGDASQALKRAAVQFGVGRYLYQLPALKAIVTDSGRYRGSFGKGKDKVEFRWDHPELPAHALPRQRSELMVTMEQLWLKACGLGIDQSEDRKTTGGMTAVERALRRWDEPALERAKVWLEGEIERVEGEARAARFAS